MTSEPSVQERYSQAFRDGTGESFAAITEPDIVLSGSIFSRPIAVPFSGPVPRDDVASVLARLLTDSRSFGSVLYLSSGAQSIEQALDEVLGITGRRES